MTKFTAIDPNGVIHTRTSKTRIYSHTVVGLPSMQASVLYAMSKQNRKLFADNYAYHAAMVGGTSRWLAKNNWETVEAHSARVALDKAKSAKELNGTTSAADYAQMKVEGMLAAIRKQEAEGYFNKYQNFGWCGRYDLAHRLATTKSEKWLDVTILEAK